MIRSNHGVAGRGPTRRKGADIYVTVSAIYVWGQIMSIGRRVEVAEVESQGGLIVKRLRCTRNDVDYLGQVQPTDGGFVG